MVVDEIPLKTSTKKRKKKSYKKKSATEVLDNNDGTSV